MAYIQLNRTAFYQNLDYYKSLVGDKNKLTIGLKDNAYGHGILEIAQLANDYGIKHVFVKNEREAMQLADFQFDSIQVLIPDDYSCLQERVSYLVNGIEQLKKIPKQTNIQLKVDTGMHRNGILPQELSEAMELINERKLNLKGVLTHFSCADEAGVNLIYEQEKIFQETIAKIRQEIGGRFKIHCANSAAVSRLDMNAYDLARIGIGAYGYSEFPEVQDKLKPILTLYAQKISQRTLAKGAAVGYGSRAYVVEKDQMTISTYNLGYGDGFLRLNERKKANVADGRPILGRVSMDSFSLEGDDEEVCVFENAKELAEAHDTIVYEITTRLSPFLKRIVR